MLSNSISLLLALYCGTVVIWLMLHDMYMCFLHVKVPMYCHNFIKTGSIKAVLLTIKNLSCNGPRPIADLH